MIKVLVAVEDYVGEQRAISHRFVHVRNLFYKSKGIDVTVLNFSSKINYQYEGIDVISLESYKQVRDKYNILICHQPNLKHHSVFLNKYGKNFEKFVFFFHGHEVLKINETYSKPYKYIKTSKLKIMLQNLYDDFKLMYWRKYFVSVVDKSHFVFVSKWMLNEFLKWTKIELGQISEKYMITYNCIGSAFEETIYDCKKDKDYDFITIRNNLDGSKYCIDFVNEIAKQNLDKKFLVIGKGQIFNHYEKAPNIVWMNKTMNHNEIVVNLQNARCALMPTRTDAQGLMMCEMASTGIPLITSDIPVCHEVFDEFENVLFIKNEDFRVDLGTLLTKLEELEPYKKNTKYYNSNTSQMEVDLIYSLVNKE